MFIYPAKSATSALAWPCLPHGGWTYSKGRPLYDVVSLPLVQGVSAVQLCGSGMLANEISNSAAANRNHYSDRLCRSSGMRKEENRRNELWTEKRALERKVTEYHASTSNCLHLYYL